MQTEIVMKTDAEYAQMVENRNRVSIPAIFVSHKRSQRNTYPRYSLLKIEGVRSKEQAEKYLGKEVILYIPKTRVQASGYKERAMVGYIHRTHGNSGIVRARFEKNLCPSYIGSHVYVQLYRANPNAFQKD